MIHVVMPYGEWTKVFRTLGAKTDDILSFAKQNYTTIVSKFIFEKFQSLENHWRNFFKRSVFKSDVFLSNFELHSRNSKILPFGVEEADDNWREKES